MSTGKRYGLILPKKGSSQEILQRPSIFDEENDSAESGSGEGDWVKKAHQHEATKSLEKKQTRIQIQKALNQDPSIYQYDEVYDDIKLKGDTSSKKKEEKQVRYVHNLKINAEKRKLENERRLERQVQKERLDEGEQFKEKETFVTSSYKKKLEEFQKMDEEEKRMDRLEEIGDVLKQKDISGFYRHLYKTTVDSKDPSCNEDFHEVKRDVKENSEFPIKKSPNKEFNHNQLTQKDGQKKQKRHYRKRTNSGSSREEGEKTTSSSSNSESEDERKSKLKKQGKEETIQSRDSIPEIKKIGIGKENIEKPLVSVTEIKIKDCEINIESTNNVKSTSEEPKQLVNIWLKRTVGPKFDDALRKYLDRKSKQ